MRILVIEDERRLAETLATILREKHFEVDLAFDGESGEAYAKLNSYDLLILDVMLPGVDGFELARRADPDAHREVGARRPLSQDLTVVITGSYELELSTQGGLLSFDAVANQTSSVSLTLTNNGNVDLQNITLSSDAPAGWPVEFSESTVSVLEAGASCELTARVTPAEDALSGDYVMTLSAENSEAEDSAEFPVADMIPAMVIVMPVSWVWSTWLLPLLS